MVAAEKIPLNLVPIARGTGSRENHGRPTMAWYFRPPVVDESGRSLTALPEDCFYTASSWMGTQVERQTRKVVQYPDGHTERHILVMDIDAHGMKVGGAPLVVMHEIGSGRTGEDSARRWGRIVKMLKDAQAEEYIVESRLLESVKDDLQYALGDPNLRNQLRERQQMLERRLAALEHTDFAALKAFFNNEAVASKAAARSSRFDIQSMVEQAVDARMATVIMDDSRTVVA